MSVNYLFKKKLNSFIFYLFFVYVNNFSFTIVTYFAKHCIVKKQPIDTFNIWEVCKTYKHYLRDEKKIFLRIFWKDRYSVMTKKYDFVGLI